MLERVCPHCGATNTAEQRRCHTCGDLIVAPLQRSSRTALTARRVQLPVG